MEISSFCNVLHFAVGHGIVIPVATAPGTGVDPLGPPRPEESKPRLRACAFLHPMQVRDHLMAGWLRIGPGMSRRWCGSIVDAR